MARAVRKLARLDEDELENAPEIVERVLGPNTIAIVPALRNHGYLQRRGSDYRILVRPDNPDLNFTIAHELGHWALRELAGFRGAPADEERAANYVGAAILAPPTVVRTAHAIWGERVRRLSRTFGLSQTSMVLRLAEVRLDERAVVTRDGNVIIRTNGAFPWTDVPIVDVALGERRWRGLAKANLRGGIDEGRVALRAR